MTPPPIKKRRTTGEADVLSGSASNSAVIRFVVSNLSGLNYYGKKSPSIEVAGLTWFIVVSKFDEDSEAGDSLQIQLECERCPVWPASLNFRAIARLCFNTNRMTAELEAPKDAWGLDASVEFAIICSNGPDKIYKKSFAMRYDTKSKQHFLLNWSDLMQPQAGLVQNDTVTIEARFSISDVKGVRPIPHFDFTDPNEPCHDVALLIGGVKVFASKQILASHSPVFKAMFYDRFDERDKREIPLKDVDPEEFTEMLFVIYPSFKNITSQSAEYLLKLADYFHVSFVIERVESFLITDNSRSNMHKLNIAVQYNLFRLQEKCLSLLKTTRDFQEVKKEAYYCEISDAAKGVLFERMLKIAKTD